MPARATILTAVLGCCLAAQTPKFVEITSHRPLASALEKIAAATRSPINFEEARYENSADLEAVSDPRLRKEIGGRPARLPRQRTLTFEFDPADPPTDLRGCLNTLLASYRQKRLPGNYELAEANGALYVAAVGSPMLSPVTIPRARRHVFQAVALIVQQTENVSGHRISPGTIPNGTAEVTFGIEGATARDALAQLYRGVNHGSLVSYHLLFDTLDNGYMLNLRLGH